MAAKHTLAVSPVGLLPWEEEVSMGLLGSRNASDHPARCPYSMFVLLVSWGISCIYIGALSFHSFMKIHFVEVLGQKI